ncbi:MAG TPA: DUF6498-containing protein [Lacunisphaera sp.]|nr:DUF6498-containing protein [Lacunisphaera sp.]
MSLVAGDSQPWQRWVSAWPDVLAFAAGLAVAWHAGWNTTDLVWSLWLASLVVGYAMIVWMIFSRALGSPLLLGGGLFLLAFFTFHFGFFHFVHSVFLANFFPVGDAGEKRFINAAMYADIARQYWMFVPVALLAERDHFRLPPRGEATGDKTGLKALVGDKNGGMMAPYRNVIRLHLLIFFFAAVHFTGLDNFFVYAVVYAVYFFPWRLVKAENVAASAET